MPALWTHHQTPTQTHWVPDPPVAASRRVRGKRLAQSGTPPDFRVVFALAFPSLYLRFCSLLASALPACHSDLARTAVADPGGPVAADSPAFLPLSRRVIRAPACRPARSARHGQGRRWAGWSVLERTCHAVLDTTDECQKGRNSCLVWI